jgi:hypothetical protein
VSCRARTGLRLGVAVLLVAAAWPACGREKGPQPSSPAATENVPTVRVATVGRGSLAETVWVIPRVMRKG